MAPGDSPGASSCRRTVDSVPGRPGPSDLLRRSALLRGLPPEALVVAAIAFCVALGFGIAAPAIPLYASSFGVSALLASAVISVFALMRFVASPGAGAAVERIGERRVLTSGLLIVALSSCFAALAQSYGQLLVLRGLGGIGSAMFTVAAMALLLRVVAPNQRGRAAGAFQAGFLIGGVLGPAVGGAVIGLSIRAPLLVYAATLLLAAAVAWRRLPAHLPDGPDRDAAPPQADDRAAAPTFRAALRIAAFRAALAANLTNGFVTFGLRMSLVPLFLVTGLGEAEVWAGIAFLVAAVTNVIVLTPGSRMSDRRGRRPAMIVGTLTTCAGMVALALAGAGWAALLAMAVLGAGSAFMGSAPAATAGDIAGRTGKGSIIAGFQMTADFGAIIGPLLAGLLADALGFSWAFMAGAAVAAAAFLLALAMQETLRTAGSRRG
jgi:MFS family permease